MSQQLNNRVLGFGLGRRAVNSKKGVELKIPLIVMHFFIEIQVYLEASVDLTIALK